MGIVSRTSILFCVVHMIITYLCHIRMKSQLLDGKLSNASTFFFNGDDLDHFYNPPGHMHIHTKPVQ